MDEELFEDDSEDGAHGDGVYGDEQDYGDCPICGGAGEMLNHGKDHWMVCHQDKVKWHVGIGFFSMFHRERPAKWDQAKAILKSYREVSPNLGERGLTASTPPSTDDDEARFRRMMGG